MSRWLGGGALFLGGDSGPVRAERGRRTGFRPLLKPELLGATNGEQVAARRDEGGVSLNYSGRADRCLKALAEVVHAQRAQRGPGGPSMP